MAGAIDTTTERTPEVGGVDTGAASASGSESATPEKRKRGRPPLSENVTRPEVARMSGFTSLDDVAGKIPSDTLTGSPDVPAKRGRKPKEVAEVNPLMQDKRYAEACANMSAFGGAKTIKTAFQVTGKPLDNDEEKEVSDFFYVVSKKYTVDPASSGIFLSIYALLMLIRFVGTRYMGTTSTDLWKQFQGIFGGEKKEEETE